MHYGLMSYPQALAAGCKDADVLEACEPGGWRDPEEYGGVFRIDGAAVKLICTEGGDDSPEDNFFYRHYSPIIDELNRLAARVNDA